jgi:hypothetical protein
MAMSEIDSFIYEFRYLLYSGKNARLEVKSESGKATVNLTVEVEIPTKLRYQAWNGSARQRRRDRRATARAAAAGEVAAADAAAVGAVTEDAAVKNVVVETEEAGEARFVEEVTDVGANQFEDAVEAKELEAARSFEPEDEIVKEVNSEDNIEEKCESVSVIPIRKVSADDDTIEKVIKDKFAEKGFTIFEFSIHRSAVGTFIHFDARIGPTSGKLLEKTDFGFSNCRVIPMFGS